MKKRILLSLAIIIALMSVFVIVASADDISPNFGTMTKVEGMTEKASFGKDGVFETASSRVLMTDGKTYPTYYILKDKTDMHLDYSELNKLAGASYSNNTISALELCEGITKILSCWNNGGFKESGTSMEYIKLPSTLEDMSTDAPFIGMTSLKVIDGFENTKVTSWPSRAFQGSPIQKLSFPSTLVEFKQNNHNDLSAWQLEVFDISNTKITEICTNAFHQNAYLKEVKLPSTLETINSYAFRNTSALEKVSGSAVTIASEAFTGSAVKTVDFSSATNLTTLALRSFFNCQYLEYVNLGSNKSTLTITTQSFYKAGVSNEQGYVTYVLPASVTLFNDYGNNWQDANNAIIYTTGNKDSSTVTSILATGKSGSAKWPTVDSKDAGFSDDTVYTTNTIIYNYNVCKAFYNNEHLPSQTTYEFEDEKYLSVCNAYSGCPRCLQSVPTKVCDALFVNKGYSKEKDGTSFTYGISINATEIEKYEQALGTTLDYGFIIQSYKDGDDGKILGADGVAQEGALLLDFTEITNLNLTIYNLKITGIQTQAQQSFSLYCAAYIIDGANVSYIGATVTDIAVPVTYASLPTKED